MKLNRKKSVANTLWQKLQIGIPSSVRWIEGPGFGFWRLVKLMIRHSDTLHEGACSGED
jgi:hypothetical protein